MFRASHVCLLAIWTSIIACLCPHILTRVYSRGLPLFTTLSTIGGGGKCERFFFSFFLAISGVAWFATCIIHYSVYLPKTRSTDSISRFEFVLSTVLGLSLGALAAIDHYYPLHFVVTVVFFLSSSLASFLTTLRISHHKNTESRTSRVLHNWFLFSTMLPFVLQLLLNSRFPFLHKHRSVVFSVFEHLYIASLLHFNYRYTHQDLLHVYISFETKTVKHE
ncbi:hypothetical protein GEMRC1_012240 [Eukaryota sp. GEM-RC1]